MVLPSGKGKVEKNKPIFLHRSVDLKNKQKTPKVSSALTWFSRYMWDSYFIRGNILSDSEKQPSIF